MREIDALDGLMGRVADAAGIQFRLLNRRKGPAVRGPRAQADRKLYAAAMQQAIRAQDGLEVIEAEVADFDIEDGRIAAVVLADGRRLDCGAVVLTTGTFLRGLIHIGEKKIPAGRMNEQASMGLSETMSARGLPARPAEDRDAAAARRPHHRLGVARNAGRRRGSGAVLADDGSVSPTGRSSAASRARRRRRTRSSDANLGRSAMYSGSIEGVGPRYCPSIEDKIVKFGDRDGHQIFLEPEGLDDDTIYPERHFDLAAGRGPARDPEDNSGA